MARKFHTQECVVCNELFRCSPSENRKYCSPKCQHYGLRTTSLTTIKCIECGIDFTPSKKSRMYCSLRCANNNNTKSKPENEKTCLVCGENFIHKDDVKTCCRQCTTIYLRINHSKVYNDDYRLKVCKMYMDGFLLSDITSDTGCDRHQISKIIKTAGIPLRAQPDYKRNILHVKAIDKTGWSTNMKGAKGKNVLTTVTELMNTKDRSVEMQETIANIKSDHKSGKSLAQLSKRYNIPVNIILEMLDE